MKKIAIVQSNYIPWKGYFDLIAAADEFIIYDDMQYTRRDWRNRNLIKTPQGVQWLTVPVLVKGKYEQKIRETLIDGDQWSSDHWKTLHQNYKRAPYFKDISRIIEPIYMEENFKHLSSLNRRFIDEICKILEIPTKISNSWDYKLELGKSERLANLCTQAGASEYISGPAAKSYLDEGLFLQSGITISWFDYSDYPCYTQQWNGFTHGVSILDLLFNTGIDACLYMKYNTRT